MHTHEIIQLPTGFRPQDFLAFHGRDKQEISEKVTEQSLRKAIFLQGSPALLKLVFTKGQVEFSLELDNVSEATSTTVVSDMVRHMLGLNQAIDRFEQTYCDHPFIGPIIVAQSGLRVPVSVSPYEALTWAIIGQQVSLSAAISMRRKFIQLTNLPHSSGLICYPSATQVAQMTPESLREAGISRSKAATLIHVSENIANSNLPLDAWLSQQVSHEDISYKLSKVKGIGPWTINYTLLRGYGWLDGSLHGDAAIRRAIRSLMAMTELTEKEAEQWLKAYEPWRALLAAHLWAWQASVN